MAIRIDAAGDYLSRTANLPAQNAVTACFWMQIVTDRNATGTLFALTDGAVNGNFVLLTSNGTTLALGRPGAIDATGTNLTVGTWYHIGYTRNSSNVSTVYLNGTQDIQETRANAFSSALMIMGSDTASWLNGRLSCIKIWGAALTQNEVRAEMRLVSPVRRADLNLWTPNFAGATERVKDYSGNARNWTANGTLTDEDGPPVVWDAWNWSLPSFAATPPASVVGPLLQGKLVGGGILQGRLTR